MIFGKKKKLTIKEGKRYLYFNPKSPYHLSIGNVIYKEGKKYFTLYSKRRVIENIDITKLKDLN